MRSVLFAGIVPEIKGTDEVKRSTRIQGAAHTIMVKKRPAKIRSPMPVVVLSVGITGWSSRLTLGLKLILTIPMAC